MAILTPLCGELLDLAIAPTSSKFGTIGEYSVASSSELDPTTCCAFDFDRLMRDDGHVGTLPDALANGVIADCIR